MSRRSWGVAAVVGVVVGGVVAGQVPAGPTAGPAAAAFKPASLTGKWSGTWTNTTFGSTGSIRANVRLKNGKLEPTIQFGGEVFGCPSPAPAIFSLSKGTGNNQYNGTGFKVKQNTAAFGAMLVSYKHATNKVTGSGKDVACRPGLTWALTGKLTSSKFTGTVNINLPDGTTATAKLAATKL